MAIFNKPTSPDRIGSSRLDAPNTDASMSVIGGGMRVIGDVESNGVIKVEGYVEGTVRGARQILLGRTGVVHGDIYAVDAILGGRVIGNVIATERVEIQGTSGIEGDIHTKSIVVHEGAMLNGTVRMGDAAQHPSTGSNGASDHEAPGSDVS